MQSNQKVIDAIRVRTVCNEVISQSASLEDNLAALRAILPRLRIQGVRGIKSQYIEVTTSYGLPIILQLKLDEPNDPKPL